MSLIGAHTSTAGGLHNALLEAVQIGADTCQIFTSNQRQWRGRAMTEAILDMWFKTLEETGIQKVMSHASYLVNLGSPKKEAVAKSRKAFQEEIDRCVALELAFLNFHPGAALDSSEEECLDTIVESLLGCRVEGDLKLVLESTAGQGSVVGWSFEQLGYIVNRVKGKVPIGVCIDTCHSFSAGYDLRDKKGWDAAVRDFEKHVGMNYLCALHVNDSMKEFGSRKDRHANLGKGEMGMECFKVMMQHPKLKKIPKYLETPNGSTMWKKEIQLLRSFEK